MAEFRTSFSTWRWRLLAAPAAALLLAAGFFFTYQALWAAGPNGLGAMSLRVTDISSGSCDSPTNPTKCTLGLSSTFNLVVNIDEPPYNNFAREDGGLAQTCSDPYLGPNHVPYDNGGDGFADEKDIDCTNYSLVQDFINFGVYTPSASEDGAGPDTCSDGSDNDGSPDEPDAGQKDATDRDCYAPALIYKARTVDQEIDPTKNCGNLELKATYGTAFVSHACVSGTYPAIVADTYTGTFATLTFNCSATNSSTLVQALERDSEIARSNGTGFDYVVDGSGRDGLVASFPISDSVTIHCSAAAGPTPTPTITRTATTGVVVEPTATPVPLGGSGVYPEIGGGATPGDAPGWLGASAGAAASVLAGLATWRARKRRLQD
jgi:hypothetical protein